MRKRMILTMVPDLFGIGALVTPGRAEVEEGSRIGIYGEELVIQCLLKHDGNAKKL